MMNKNLLAGKKVIITGASYGIGKAIAIGFTELGAEVGIISRTKEKLEDVVNIITKKGYNATYEVADVSNYERLKSAIDKLIKKFGKVDILINNAGVSRMKEFSKMKPHQIDLTIDINFKGMVYCTHLLLPHFIENNSGVIISTSSVSSLLFQPINLLYGATKLSINYLTEALPTEFSSKNIRFHAILPGATETPMFHFGLTNEQVQASNPIQPKELVPYYAFYASDLAKEITGKLVNIESFRAAFRIINNLDETQAKTLDCIVPILKEKLQGDIFSNINANKDLLKMLLTIKDFHKNSN
ncbi:MAG: SDR family NAD(P)-dependent oxidoreductase [Promethearchaeota archaeon]